MKTGKRVLSIILAVVMVVLTVAFAFADDNTASNHIENVSVSVSTDKSKYEWGDKIVFNVTVKNNGNETVKDLAIGSTPKRATYFTAENKEDSATIASLAPGESKTVQVSYTAKKWPFFERVFILPFTAIYDAIFGLLFNMGLFDATASIKVGLFKYKFGFDIKEDADYCGEYEELIKGVNINKVYEENEKDISKDNLTGITFINNIIIIDFADRCSKERRAEIINSLNGKVVGGIKEYNELHVQIQKANLEQLKSICSELNKNDDLLASVDYMTNGISSNIPNDHWTEDDSIIDYTWTNPFEGLNTNIWNMIAVDAPGAWKYNQWFNTIPIGVIDNGFCNNHPDLNINVISDTNTPEDHGTHVAGIIGATANNNKGVAGIVWNKRLLAYDAVEESGGKFKDSDVYAGLCKLVSNGCKVVNLSVSYSGDLSDSTHNFSDSEIQGWGMSALYKLAFLMSKGYDFVVVQAAGNGASDSMGVDAKNAGYFSSIAALNNIEEIENGLKKNFEPTAAFENAFSKKTLSVKDITDRVVVVANAMREFQPNKYVCALSSNGNKKYVDIAAPGTPILSTVQPYNIAGSTQYYQTEGGTSMAAPLVAGVASLVWSVNSTFKGNEVRDIVIDSAKAGGVKVEDNPGSSNTTGSFYMVNAKLAVEEAMRRTYSMCTVKGKVVDSKTSKGISGAEVEIKNFTDNKVLTTQTASDGTFSILVRTGQYNISCTKTGYRIGSATVYNVPSENQIVNVGNIKMVAENGNVFGTVKDSKTNEPITGVSVEIIDNSSSGFEPIQTLTTNESGSFSADLQPGSYSFSFHHDDYEYTGINVTVESQNVLILDTVYMSKKGDSGGEEPNDPDQPGSSDGTGSADNLSNLGTQGGIIQFGAYPQTKVTDSTTISALNSRASGWKSYHYYSGTGNAVDGQMTAKDYMVYCDVNYGKNKYRGVTFSQYRPGYTGDTSSAIHTYQDENGYITGTTYWFKYEPLLWKVLDPSQGMVLCLNIIDSQPYNSYIYSDGSYDIYDSKIYWGDAGKTHYANDYANSSIRKWLNETFFATAFSTTQQNCIAVNWNQYNTGYYTQTDNGNYIGYSSAQTDDKIFLLSYYEVLNTTYGFPTSPYSSSTRQASGTDYAKCQGLSDSWFLRSPGNDSGSACFVRSEIGSVFYWYGVNLTYGGIRPACKLKLN